MFTQFVASDALSLPLKTWSACVVPTYICKIKQLPHARRWSNLRIGGVDPVFGLSQTTAHAGHAGQGPFTLCCELPLISSCPIFHDCYSSDLADFVPQQRLQRTLAPLDFGPRQQLLQYSMFPFPHSTRLPGTSEKCSTIGSGDWSGTQHRMFGQIMPGRWRQGECLLRPPGLFSATLSLSPYTSCLLPIVVASLFSSTAQQPSSSTLCCPLLLYTCGAATACGPPCL